MYNLVEYHSVGQIPFILRGFILAQKAPGGTHTDHDMRIRCMLRWQPQLCDSKLRMAYLTYRVL